ncbi:SDR family NAD(P)-dependent oxidoreductase [Paenibacillus nanensis]|uniref:SDR family NAD(P)-dependent oxidoreductase n=1 Tax=Paenibacillus nanensis TaxID=393251 RepID=A0A3A1V0B0_9BACL|nr:SDR family NAD(P)-dependent oxidoreductase [Paenibacillus nanensis]RIX53935.1 SDR family NAD(P)-dependent oxidoreductase [Paenibacillus nanensis]
MPPNTLLESVLFPAVRLNKEKLGRMLQGKTILITGASSGIGERLSYLLGEFDVRLILVARREEKLLAMKREIEEAGAARVDIHAGDLRKEEVLGELLRVLLRLQDGLDIVVSNAGLSIRRPVMDSLDRYHDFTRTMAINYFAPVRLLLSVIPQLLRNKGHVINVSTINTSLIPFPNWAAYQASKSAFDTWLRAAAPEWQALGVSITSVYLPLVRTPMIEPTAAYRKLPAMSAEHAARTIAKSMYTRRQSLKPWWLIFGQLASLLGRGLWERYMPGVLRRKGERDFQ